MNVHILSESEGVIPLSDREPTYLWEYKIPGARSLVGAGAFGDLLLQETTGNGYSIWYHNFQFKRGELITMQRDEPVWCLRLVLNNTFHYTEARSGSTPMHERGYNLLYIPEGQEKISFRDKAYTSLEVYFSKEYLASLAPHYPHLRQWMNDAEGSSTTRLCKVNQVATETVVQCVNDLLNSPYSNGLRTMQYDAVIKELLITILQETATRPLRKIIRFTTREIEAVYELKNFLRKNMDKPLRAEELTTQFDASQRTLKRRFSTLFGISLFHFLLGIRMQQAGMLLQETDTSIENIATLTGYRSFANFSTAFKKYYGQSPSYFRNR